MGNKKRPINQGDTSQQGGILIMDLGMEMLAAIK